MKVKAIEANMVVNNLLPLLLGVGLVALFWGLKSLLVSPMLIEPAGLVWPWLIYIQLFVPLGVALLSTKRGDKVSFVHGIVTGSVAGALGVLLGLGMGAFPSPAAMLVPGLVVGAIGAAAGAALIGTVEWCRHNLGMAFSGFMAIYILVPLIAIFRTCTIAGYCSSNVGTGLNRPPIPHIRVVAYLAKPDGSKGELLYSTYTDGAGNFTFSRMRKGDFVVACGNQTMDLKADYSLRGGTQQKEFVFEPGEGPPQLPEKHRVHGQNPSKDEYSGGWGAGG